MTDTPEVEATSGTWQKVPEPEMILLDHNNAVCSGGRWHGWRFTRHPDGQWVSAQKLQIETAKVTP